MDDIDKMTMELLMNKRKYNKYISKNDPEKYEKQQKEYEKMQKYASRIMHLTEELLSDPNMSVQNQVNESFIQYVKSCIYHFETRDLELAGCKDSYENDDDDAENEVMFEKCENENDATPAHTSSYWGKSIHKLGTSHIDSYFYPKK